MSMTVLQRETVRQWLVRHRQTPRLIELLWEPLAVAALNQSIDEASGAAFAGVLRRMFTQRSPRLRARAAAEGARRAVCDSLARVHRARRRRRASQRAGARDMGRRCDGARCDGAGLRRCVCAMRSCRPRPSSARRPGTRCLRYFRIDRRRSNGAARRRVHCCVADRHRQSLVRSAGDEALFVGLPGRAMQWVFDKRALFGDASSHLSLVSSGATALVGQGNQELVDLALRELTAALPDVSGAVLRRAVVVREKRATFSVAPGQPPRPPIETADPGTVSRRRLDRYRPPRYDRERCRQRPPRRRRGYEVPETRDVADHSRRPETKDRR